MAELARDDTLHRQKSPTFDAACVSNACVTALIAVVTLVLAAEERNGPACAGLANQSPWVTGVEVLPAGTAALTAAPDPLSVSGSPGYGPKSNATGAEADDDFAVTATLCVIVGTIHSGGSFLAESGSL